MNTGSRLSISKINEKNQRASLEGWVNRYRNLGKIIFIELRDSTGLLQVVASKDKTTAGFELAGNLKPLDFIRVEGYLRWTKQVPELVSESIELVARGNIAKRPTGRHMELRQTQSWAVLRIRDRLIQCLTAYLRENGFINAPPPAILPLNKNSGFQFDFYGFPATLSQSGALYMSALALSFGRVFSLHPVFRSEKSKTSRHLAEFWMLEFEAAPLDLNDLIYIVEDMVKKTIEDVLDNCIQELKILGRDISALHNSCRGNFPRMDYNEVVKRLRQEGYGHEWGSGLGKHERVAANWFDKPIFIVNFPRLVGSWTAQPVGFDVGLSVNLLAPDGYGEILEGCQRNTDPVMLEKKFQSAGVELGWYVDIHRYGGMVHSGAGLGIERFCQWVCGKKNIRDVIPFPRTMNDFYP